MRTKPRTQEEIGEELQKAGGNPATFYSNPIISSTYSKKNAAGDDIETEYETATFEFMKKPGGMIHIYRTVPGRKAENFDDYQNATDYIYEYTRKKGYCADSHKPGMERREDSGRVEENLCYDLFSYSQLEGDKSVIDYQVPLKNKQGDRLGKIDLVMVEGRDVILLEAKKGDSKEYPLRAIAEICTYYRTLDKENFLKDMMAPNEEGESRPTQHDEPYRICCGILADTTQGDLFLRRCKTRSYVPELLELLNAERDGKGEEPIEIRLYKTADGRTIQKESW
jgi:hypothetical protein